MGHEVYLSCSLYESIDHVYSARMPRLSFKPNNFQPIVRKKLFRQADTQNSLVYLPCLHYESIFNLNAAPDFF